MLAQQTQNCRVLFCFLTLIKGKWVFLVLSRSSGWRRRCHELHLRLNSNSLKFYSQKQRSEASRGLFRCIFVSFPETFRSVFNSNLRPKSVVCKLQPQFGLKPQQQILSDLRSGLLRHFKPSETLINWRKLLRVVNLSLLHVDFDAYFSTTENNNPLVTLFALFWSSLNYFNRLFKRVNSSF